MPAPRGVFALLSCLLITVAAGSAGTPAWSGIPNVAWPASSGLLLAEVMTGGGSASDEFVEIANAGSVAADLAGTELVYVTASGATITRKAGFTAPLLLVPGQHLLVANSAGMYGPLADVTYTGGLAADGGAVALRGADGTVIDSLGWGTASNSYVEGTIAPAAPPNSSLERLPGGLNGNTQDTNDNEADWFVQPAPTPQSLASAPVPGSSSSPGSTASAADRQTTGQTESAIPTASTSITSGQTAQNSTPQTTGAATATPQVVATPTFTATPFTPAPTGESVEVLPIDSARALSIGAEVHVAGVATSEVGLAGDGIFALQDSSGGIFVRPPVGTEGIKPGDLVEVQGTLAAPYGQLEIRNLGRIEVGAVEKEPVASPASLADVGEATEGSLIMITGSVDSVQTDGGRLTIALSDGITSVRVLADPPAGILRTDVARGDVVDVIGVVGQHASATGRLDGYRLWPRDRTDLVVERPDQTDPPVSLPDPTETSVYYDLASALGMRGAEVDVEAVVTAQAGLANIAGPTIVVDDGSAALAVVLPTGAVAPGIGMRVRVTGKVGRWQGGPTILATRVESEGEMADVAPRSTAGPLDSSLEWQLVRVCGRVTAYTPAGSRWVLEIATAGHQILVLGEPATGISMSKSAVGRLAVVIGIVRRSSSDSSTFQLLPRVATDLRLGSAASTAAATTAGSARSSASGRVEGAQAIEIGSVSAYLGKSVIVTGLVLETAEGTATVDDGTGSVRVGGPDAADAISAMTPGDAVEVAGVVGRDAQGLLIDADPESIVDLPADGSAPGAGDSGTTLRLTDVTAGPATPVAPEALRREQPGAQVQLSGQAMLLLLIAIPLLALAAAVVAIGYWLLRRSRSRCREGH
ncbi:MAG TPA: lamin tail domain-containing protein [Candidatus Limnocylindrales bacterium]